MVDLLSLLRKYNVSKKEIIERDGHIIFGEIAWPKHVKTNYLIAGKKGAPKEYYTLECILFFLKNSMNTHPDYVGRAAAENIPSVRRPDRKKLLAYLNGQVASCESIDKNVSLDLPTQVKRSADYDEGLERTPKKPHFENLHKQSEKLDRPIIQSAVGIDNIKSLSEIMSVEKMEAIKAKRLANKLKSKEMMTLL